MIDHGSDAVRDRYLIKSEACLCYACVLRQAAFLGLWNNLTYPFNGPSIDPVNADLGTISKKLQSSRHEERGHIAMTSNSKRVLSIAGSDSGGGAGIQADLKTFTALGVYGCTALTAITAQNTIGVDGIHTLPADFVKQQLESTISDIGVDMVKVGMLASKEIIDVIVECITKYDLKRRVVLDPVMVSTSGHRLLEEDAVESLIKNLLPLSFIVTPNIAEATILSRWNKPINTVEDIKAMAKNIHASGVQYVLIKGGHTPLDRSGKLVSEDSEKHHVIDVLYDGKVYIDIQSPYSNSKNTHGTGCTLSSAIAAYLAKRYEVPEAVKSAIDYVQGAIAASLTIGKGNGPLNHMHSLQILPFAKGQFIHYLTSHTRVQKPWNSYTHHSFVQQMSKGTLPISAFRYYLIQDYLFLTNFMRSNALAAYKSTKPSEISRSADIIAHVERERKLHVDFCTNEFGMTLEQLQSTPEDMANVAYTRWVMDIGHSGDWLGLQVAMAACLLGYGAIGKRLIADPNTVSKDNKYYKWIQTYAGQDYSEAVKLGEALLEGEAFKQSPSRIDELVDIFAKGVDLEIGFWDMGLAHS